jgi:hypothetical protein
MTSTSTVQAFSLSHEVPIQEYIGQVTDELLASLPDPAQLSGEERRALIARYTSVLEGNFIYWMTAAYLAVETEQSRAIILDNLQEEIRDCHPGMLRRFAMAAQAVPTQADALEVYRDLANVRLFIGRLSAVPVVIMMAFFEGYIQRFMAFLAELAELQGSSEMEYTDVHGVCDVAHTQGLFQALAAEMSIREPLPTAQLFEGVDLLRTLLKTIVAPDTVQPLLT